MKDAFAGFVQQILKKKKKKKKIRIIFGKIYKKTFSHASQILAIKGVWVYSLKNENLWQKSFSVNVEWSSKKL